MLGVLVVDGVADQAGVPVTGLVEGLQDGLAVRLILLLLELLGLEEVVPLVGVGVLHGLGELVFRHVLVVAGEVDVLDADLVALLHVEVHPDGAADHGILLHLRVHLDQEVALFLEITFDDVLGSALYVVGEFAARTEVQALLQVLPLTGLDAGIGPAGDPGALLDDDLEPGGVLRRAERVHDHGHVLEESLGDQALDDAGHFLARDGEFHALADAGQLQDLVLAEVLVAFHTDAAHHVGLGISVIYLDRFPPRLGPEGHPREAEQQEAGYLAYHHRRVIPARPSSRRQAILRIIIVSLIILQR